MSFFFFRAFGIIKIHSMNETRHSRKSYRALFNSGQQGPIKRESDKWKWRKLFCCAANISDPLCCWDRLRFQFSFFTSAQITQSLLQQKVIGEVAISQVEQWCSICNSHNNVFQLAATSSSSSLHPHCEQQNIDVNIVQWPRACVVMMRVLQHIHQMFSRHLNCAHMVDVVQLITRN